MNSCNIDYIISKESKVLHIELDESDKKNTQRQINFYKRNGWYIERNY